MSIASCLFYWLVMLGQFVGGCLLAVGLALALVAMRLWYDETSISTYAWIAANAVLLPLGALIILLYFRERQSRKIFFIGFGLMFAYIAAASALSYTQYRKDNLAQSEDFVRSAKLIADEHRYVTPEVNNSDWIFWYWNSVLSPLGGGSPISSDGGEGQKCWINRSKGIWPFRLQTYASTSKDTEIHADSWLRGALAHELAHCFDAQHSVPGDYASWTKLPPYLKAVDPVHINEFRQKKRTDIVLWGEIVADLQEIGYWRLTEDSSRAQFLERELSRSRKEMAGCEHQDREHATSCWLDFAQSLPGPASMKELFTWASNARMQGYSQQETGCAAELKSLSSESTMAPSCREQH
jgi:hypothetical protein